MKTTLTLLLFIITAASTSAQVPMLRWDDPDTSGWSSTIAFHQLSDVDGDGYPEILFPHRDQGASTADLWVYSLALHQPLIVIPGSTQEGSHSGLAIHTVTDFTNDGLRDLLLRRQDDFGLGSLELRSGLDGSVVWHVDETVLGETVSMSTEIDDVDNDGINDVFSILITPTFFTRHGQAYSGVDGSILYDVHEGFDMVRPYSLGDLDGDGAGDFGVRSIGNNFFIYSGATGTQIQTRSAAANANFVRKSMVGVGDIDGDGVNDWAEAWQENSFFPTDSAVHFFTDILNPREIGVYEGQPYDRSLGDTPIFAHDFDGDGLNDILLRSNVAFQSSITLFSPVNGIIREWAHFLNPRPHALEEDWDGDGMPDLLLQTATTTGHTLLISSLQEQITVSSRQISQASGGTLTFTVNAGTRYAGRRVQLFAGDGLLRPFKAMRFVIPGALAEAVGFPFHPTGLTRSIFDRRNNPALADWTTTLDSQGQATLTIAFAPGEIPLTDINKQIHFTAVIDSATPPFPETSTERVSVNVLP
jgi:hypothetical protein